MSNYKALSLVFGILALVTPALSLIGLIEADIITVLIWLGIGIVAIFTFFVIRFRENRSKEFAI